MNKFLYYYDIIIGLLLLPVFLICYCLLNIMSYIRIAIGYILFACFFMRYFSVDEAYHSAGLIMSQTE